MTYAGGQAKQLGEAGRATAIYNCLIINTLYRHFDTAISFAK
jgi:hypothetical protein